MGYNSAIMICNDAMDQIDKDPAGWWEAAKRAIFTRNRKDNDGTFGFGNHANGFQAICCDHADVINIVAIGGNHAAVLGFTYGSIAEAEQVLLQALAEKHGYSLKKKKDK